MAITDTTLSGFEKCQQVYVDMLQCKKEILFEEFVRKVAHDNPAVQISTVVLFYDHLIKP